MTAESAPEPEPFCKWPGCVEDVAVSVDGGETWLCWTHLTDDFLPPLEAGVIGYCVHCNTATVLWWVQFPESEDLPFHPRCLRAHFLAIAQDGAPAVELRTQHRGAYARREGRRE